MVLKNTYLTGPPTPKKLKLLIFCHMYNLNPSLNDNPDIMMQVKETFIENDWVSYLEKFIAKVLAGIYLMILFS